MSAHSSFLSGDYHAPRAHESDYSVSYPAIQSYSTHTRATNAVYAYSPTLSAEPPSTIGGAHSAYATYSMNHGDHHPSRSTNPMPSPHTQFHQQFTQAEGSYDVNHQLIPSNAIISSHDRSMDGGYYVSSQNGYCEGQYYDTRDPPQRYWKPPPPYGDLDGSPIYAQPHDSPRPYNDIHAAASSQSSNQSYMGTLHGVQGTEQYSLDATHYPQNFHGVDNYYGSCERSIPQQAPTHASHPAHTYSASSSATEFPVISPPYSHHTRTDSVPLSHHQPIPANRRSSYSELSANIPSISQTNQPDQIQSRSRKPRRADTPEITELFPWRAPATKTTETHYRRSEAPREPKPGTGQRTMIFGWSPPEPELQPHTASPTPTLKTVMVKKGGESIKKQSLACLFCRERKIACGRPAEGSTDHTCNQCARRSFKCEYPTESRRGQHKRSRRKTSHEVSGSK